MSETNNRSGIFVGLNHGRVVTRPTNVRKTRPVDRKGRNARRNLAIRQVIREVAGFSPLEKRMMELIRTGIATKEKKSVKMARARLGTHRRALAKKAELEAVIIAQQRRE